MFKLEAIQSHLQEFDSTDRLYNGANRAISASSWQNQAAELLEGTNAHNFQSLAIAFEVRTAEAFKECDRQSGPRQVTEAGDLPPDALRTAISCTLLGELGAACKPFARPLQRIRDELARGIFSGYYTSDDGSLRFKQLPYFAVVQRLEAEKELLLREAEGLRAAIQEQKADHDTLEARLEEMELLVEQTRNDEAAAATQAEATKEAIKNAQVEAAAAREETKAARRELLKLRNEDNTLRALHSLTRSKLEQQAASFEQHTADLEERLAAAAALADADAEAAQQRIATLESQLQGALDSMEAAKTEAAALAARQAEQLSIAAALLVPDPAPCGPIVLRVAVAPMCSFVTGLGLGEHVPRFLRWSGNLALHEISREELLAQIGSIWSGKRDYECRHGALISLQAFLFHKFWGSAEGGQPGTGAATGTAEGGQNLGTTPSQSLDSARMGSLSAFRLSSRHARAAQAGYTLVHAAQKLAGTSFEAALFLRILTGELHEDAYLQSRSVLQSLEEFQSALENRGVEPTMTRDKTLEALQLLLPACSPAQLTSSMPSGDRINILELVGLPDRAGNEGFFTPFVEAVMQIYIHRLQLDTAALADGMRHHLDLAATEGPLSTESVMDAIQKAASASHVTLDSGMLAAKVQAAVQRSDSLIGAQTDHLFLTLQVPGFAAFQNFTDVSAAIAWLEEQYPQQNPAAKQ
ncbi:hypothetical protein COCOBI_01-3160 [Coccomyxa sp. Obi]|nr:hypothetical protein COCOBI_01-3160 [Coccomyxa sp. Obi]